MTGLWMPAEWERHAATWVAWPHNPETWPGCLDAAQREFRAFVRALARCERVEVLVQDEALRDRVAAQLADEVGRGDVRLHVYATDDVWMRDIGPTFVFAPDASPRAIDWTFNAWGGKYASWERDDAAAARVAELAGVERIRPGLVLEGGALEVDGAGTLLATTPTLIDPDRNPELDAPALEARLRELLGVSRILWLGEGIAGDDTDGHVDDFARFVAPGRVVCAHEPDPADANAAPLAECAERLRKAGLEVVDLPMPPPVFSDEGHRLPASYANFYIANGAVFVPAFGEPSDARALDVLAPLFPGRSVTGLPARTLVRGLGAFHCLTQQQPAAAGE